MINMAALTNYVAGDEELLIEVTKVFLSESPNTIATIQNSLDKGDAITAGRNAHKYKGSAAIYGCDEISAIAKEIEEIAKKNELAKMKTLFDQLKALHIQLIKELNELLKQKTSANQQ